MFLIIRVGLIELEKLFYFMNKFDTLLHELQIIVVLPFIVTMNHEMVQLEQP